MIELMIVVAIVGILAAVAVPAYMNYVIRAQISEGMKLTAGAKTAVASYFQERGTFPADNLEAALPDAALINGDYVTSVSIDGAEISVRYGNEANGRISGETITVAASTIAGSLTWSCVSDGVIEQKHLPRVCD